MSSLEETIRATVKERKVVMYSKSGCPFCQMAKDILKQYHLPAQDYKVIDVRAGPEGNALQTALKNITGAKTVPRVFINGKCIGGGEDTRRLNGNGKLEKLLKGT